MNAFSFDVMLQYRQNNYHSPICPHHVILFTCVEQNMVRLDWTAGRADTDREDGGSMAEQRHRG